MPVKLDLSGLRLLVVGASSGLGRALARLAATVGARVAVAARRRERLEELAAEVRAAGGEAVAVSCDVTRDASCREAVAASVQALGGLDALVYAAGIALPVLLREADRTLWHRHLDTNLVGASQVTAAAIPALEVSQGRALYVSSYAVRQSLPGLALYGVSKVALDRLIEAWRMEHPTVDFTRALLGNTEGTEFASTWGAERTAKFVKLWVEGGLFPSATMMKLEDAAEAILSVLALRGFVDDLAVMPRRRDSPTEP